MITIGMNVTLGEAFTILRNRRGYTVREASKESGLYVSVIESIETDDEENMTLKDVIALATMYDLYLHVGLLSQQPQLLGTEKDNIDKETDDEQ